MNEPWEQSKPCFNFRSAFFLFTTITIILFVVCISLASYCYMLYSENTTLSLDLASQKQTISDMTARETQLNTKMSQLTDEVSDLNKQIESSNSNLSFWESHAVIVTTTGSVYHKYGCFHLSNNPYYIYNVEAAIAKGYTPCLDCRPPLEGGKQQIVLRYTSDSTTNYIDKLRGMRRGIDALRALGEE